MKKAGVESAMITPAAEGWLLHSSGTAAQPVATLAEAVGALPASTPVSLALPCTALVIEGLKLPATERDELAGMVRLQLEKNLPYPIEEVSSDFVVVRTEENESSVITFSAPHSSLDALCEPLREGGRLPETVTPYVLHVVAACPAEETVLAVYPEQGQIVLAISAGGRLAWAHVIASMDPARLAAELPQALLAAAMEGAPSSFSRVLLAADCRTLDPVLRDAVPVDIDELPAVAPALDSSLNLEPATWLHAALRQQRIRRLRRQLQVAGVFYFIAVIAAVVYLVLLRQQAAKVQAQLAAVRPQLELVQSRQARSNALAGATDPSRTTLELLYLLQRDLPAESVRITEFDVQSGGQWRVTGEAPNANLAIDYVTRIKGDKDLTAYQINAGPPQLLPNEHAQFSIFGKR